MSIHFFQEMDRVKKLLFGLSALVEESLSNAVLAIEKRDAELACKVIEDDDKIDMQEIHVEEECLKVLALHQPVAADLRYIVSVMKINNDLERIGDLAVNIAERAVVLSRQKIPAIGFNYSTMARKVKEMVKMSLDAAVNVDAHLARRVCAEDDIVDEINRDMYTQVKEAIVVNPQKENVETLLHLLSVSRSLERIGDHATNIAQDIIYMIEAKIIRHNAESNNSP